MSNEQQTIRPHDYATATNGSGQLLRICRACGETTILQHLVEEDKDGRVVKDEYAWWPVGEVTSDGKRRDVRGCPGAGRGRERDDNQRGETTVIRRS